MSNYVVLYEWMDERGEVEDFIVLDLLSSVDNFFKFPDAIRTIVIDEEEAKMLRLDYEGIKEREGS